MFSSLTTAGPLGRTVADAALLFAVMTGTRRGTPEPIAFHGLRVAWAPTLGGRIPVDSYVRDVLDEQRTFFESEGAIVEEACPDLDGSEDAFRVLRAAEFNAEWGNELREDPGDFPEQLSQNIREGAALSAVDVVRAEREVTRLIRAASGFFEHYDVLLAPAAQVPPFDLKLVFPGDVDGVPQRDYLDWMRAAFLFTPLAIPGVSVPAGFAPDGSPIGLQMLSGAGNDWRLLQIARTFEDATGFGAIEPRL
jgi:amidase